MNVFVIISLILIVVGIIALLYSLIYLNRQKTLAQFNVEMTHEKRFDLANVLHVLNGVFSSEKEDIEGKFVAAGFYDVKLAKYYMPMKYIVLCIGAGGIFLLHTWLQFSTNTFIVLEAVFLIAVLIGPDSYLASRAKSLRNAISQKLPYMLDLMAVCVQTGMTIEAAISYLSQEFGAFDKDLSHLLRKVDERARLVGLEQSLQELYERVPTDEIRSFVMTLNQSLQYGSSIYSVLTTLSADIREVQLLHVEEKIGQLSAKMSIPLIVFIMVPIVILIAAPGVMRMMQNANF